MNFLEAVQALQEGLCKSISPGRGIMYVLNSENKIVHELDNAGIKLSPELLLSSWRLVDPIQQYKEVKVVAYLNNKTNEVITDLRPSRPVPDPKVWTKLTGIQKVEVKPKVKKRVELKTEGFISSFVQYKSIINPIIPNSCVELFAEWYEDVDQSGKDNCE